MPSKVGCDRLLTGACCHEVVVLAGAHDHMHAFILVHGGEGVEVGFNHVVSVSDVQGDVKGLKRAAQGSRGGS